MATSDFEYEFRGTENLNRVQQMIYVHTAFYSDLFNQAKEEEIQFNVDFDNLHYKLQGIKPNGNLKQSQTFQKLCMFSIVIYETLTAGEAISKIRILKDDQKVQALKNILGCEDLKIIDNQEINIDAFPETFLPEIWKLAEKSNQIVFVMSRTQQRRLNQFQQLIQQFINDTTLKKLVTMKLNKSILNEPFYVEFLQELQHQQNEVQVQMQIETNYVLLNIFTWVSVDQQQQMDIRIKQVQDLVTDVMPTQISKTSQINLAPKKKEESAIYNSNVIDIKVTEAIDEWELFLQKKFKDSNLVIKKNKEIAQLQIYFVGNREKIRHLQKKTQDEIIKTELSLKQMEVTQEFPVIVALQENKIIVNSQLQQEFSKEMCVITIIEIEAQQKQILILLQIIHERSEVILKQYESQALKFFSELKSLEIQLGLQQVIQQLGIDDIQKFCQKHKLLYQKYQNKDYFVGNKDSIEEIKMILDLVGVKREQPKQELISRTIVVANPLIYLSIQKSYERKYLRILESCFLQFPYNTNSIIVQCFTNQLLDSSVQIIEQFKNEQFSKLRKTTFQVEQQTIDYLKGEGQGMVRQLEEQNMCKIQIDKIDTFGKGRKEYVIQSNAKKLIIKQGSLPDEPCDLIVLQTSNYACLNQIEGLGESTQRIIKMFGNEYVQLCQNTICNLPHDQNYIYTSRQINKTIINIVTPTYKYGGNEQFQFYDDIILKNLRTVFETANRFKLRSLVLQVSGCGSCNNAFLYTSQATLIHLINNFFNTNCNLTTVYLVEQYEQRYDELKSAAYLLLYPQKRRQAKYEWKWQNENAQLVPYEFQINSQIDYQFEKYQQNSTQNKFQLEFSFLQFNPTHEINLFTLTIKDLKKKTLEKLKPQVMAGRKLYTISNILIDERLNNYINLQELENEKIFSVCLDNYCIVFQNNHRVIQESPTKFARMVIKSPSNFNNQRYYNHCLLNQSFQTNEPNSSASRIAIKSQLEIQSLSIESENIVIDQIRRIQNPNIKLIIYRVPNLFDEEMQNLKRLIQESSIAVDKEIFSGQEITIKIHQRELNKLEFNLQVFSSSNKVYPNYWNPQRDLVVKIELNPSSPEYQRVATLFRETDKGQVLQIKRIQNKILWENYASEKSKLQKFHHTQGYKMTPDEETRLVWHGVKSQHPEIIYKGLKEGFNCAYSRTGMWGPGIYFAQNAKYSRDYSYQLQNEEGPKFAGKLIMLCCLLTTGRIEKRAADPNIRTPRDGFDSVSGWTNGSTVYILYSMDIRRAYPAYEVIFQ